MSELVTASNSVASRFHRLTSNRRWRHCQGHGGCTGRKARAEAHCHPSHDGLADPACDRQ